MIIYLRKLLWRILGFDYQNLLRKTDYVLLKDDLYTTKGKGTYDNGAIVWRWTNAPLTIGKFCSIANNVQFVLDEGFHKSSQITSYPLINNLFKDENILPNGLNKEKYLSEIKQRQGIVIGHDVWIGIGAYIMPGVSVGNGAIIGANTVVTKDVPDYAVVGGTPAKVIKIKHNPEVIEKLNKIAWWNWEQEKIKESFEDFYGNINEFILKHFK